MGSTNKIKKFKQGFTLLEVLVATSIFTIIMIMTTATVAQSSSYRTKLKIMREVNEETRRLADMVTRDVRSANQEIKIEAHDDDVTISTRQFKNGIAMLNANQNYIINQTCLFALNRDPSTELPGEVLSGNGAQILILGTTDKYKIYFTSTAVANPFGVFYGEHGRLNPDGSVYILTEADISEVLVLGAGANDNNRISSTQLSVVLAMAGYAPDDTSATASQPYVQFMITAKSPDYNTDQVRGAKAMIRSSVTSRSYNN